MNIKFKHKKCDFCSRDNIKELVECDIQKADADIPVKRMKISKCKNCGLVYVADMPDLDREEMKKLYSEDYFNTDYMKFYNDVTAKQTNETFKWRLDIIKDYKSGGRLLDIGCASGGFLKYAALKGWEVYGVEFSEETSETARVKKNLDVKTGTIYDAGYDDGYFDVVSAGDIIEHVDNPKKFLKEIKRVLKKDGILYLALPDFGGLYFKFFKIIAKRNHRNYFVLPHHIYFFTKKIIKKYLKDTGFKIETIKKTNSNILDKGFKKLFFKILNFFASILFMKDRMVIIARKR